MNDLCDRPGCTVIVGGQTYGWMRRVGMAEDGLPIVRIYCSQTCVEADRG